MSLGYYRVSRSRAIGFVDSINDAGIVQRGAC